MVIFETDFISFFKITRIMRGFLFVKQASESDCHRFAATGLLLLLLTFGAAQSNITRLEYYIDNDPGFGKATPVSITPNASIAEKVIGLNPAGISEGVHRFYVRAQNATGAWSFTNSMLFYKPISSNGTAPASPAAATNITRVEYYIDIDPGIGKATNVSITPGADLSNVIIPLNPGPLAEGVHTFYLRARNAGGAWSFTNALPFFKPIGSNGGEVPGAPAPPTNITKVEYYIDADPGFGKATNVSITPGTDLSNVLIPINPGPLAEGVHTFYVRARNAGGAWSFTNALPFFKPIGSNGGQVPGAPAPATHITKLEYYIDTDPGFGKATNVSITPETDLSNVIIPINPGPLAEGVHTFYVRARNAGGAWSFTNALPFFKPIGSGGGEVPGVPAAATNITKLEYYIDTDPGFGKATNVSITPGIDLSNVIIPINPNTLSEGVHTFYLRARDAGGAWSFTNALAFFKPIGSGGDIPGPPLPPSNIVRLEYYIDTDPGYGKAKTVTITPGLDIKDVIIGVDINNLSLGKHIFYVRVLNAKGAWSMMNALEFSNGTAPTTTISSVFPTSVCSGDTIKISGSSFIESLDPNTQSVKINTTQGIIVSTSSTIIQAIFNQAATGKIIVSNINGIDTSSETVTIHALPIVSSISNQEICAGGSTAAINFSGTATSYSWTNNNTASGLASNGSGNIASFIAQNNTSSIVVSTITVTPLNTNGCKGTPTSFNIAVDPILTVAPVISQNGPILSTNFTPGGVGITGYQWMKDNMTIPGANASTFQPSVNGTYSAAFNGICGLGPKSNAINIDFPTGVTKGIYVDSSAISGLNNGTSWPNAYTRLQDALVNAKARDTILVAKGTYFADLGNGLINNNRSLSFMIPDSMLVLGGFPQGGGSLNSRNWVINKTILSGEIQQDGLIANNSYHVVRTSRVSNATTLDGFEITGGNANNTAVPDNSGGGWYNDGSGNGLRSNPTIKNCVFIYNSAKQGGALYNHADNGGQASPVVINSRFLHNSALTGNGGALYNLSANNGHSSAQFTNCIFHGNQAKNGGALFNNAVTGFNNTTFINCLLYSNSALEGAATNSTSDPGACITTFTNSIIWAHKNSFFNLKATVNVAYSITEATTGYINGGNNKIGQNPFFVMINSDFHLQSKSPAINSGNNTANNLSIDLDGNPRIIHNTIDMGPYEYQAVLFSQSLTETRSSSEESNIVLYQNIPNPFDHGTRIGILLTNEDRGILKITDLLGRTIKIYDQVWLEGYNEVILNRNELKGNGVYYYSFEGKNFKAVKKMLLVQ